MTNEDYLNLQKEAAASFYYDNKKKPPEIIIPENQVYGMLAQGSDTARAATRVATKDQIRTVLTLDGPVYTGKFKQDGVFERFATPTSGTGAKLSNQRALRSNPYIEKFVGELKLSFDNAHVNPKRVNDFLVYCGREVGIGASRKMNYGRFTVELVS